MCGGDERREKMGIVERCEQALDRIEGATKKMLKIMETPKVEVKFNGDHIRATGDGKNTEFVNDRGGGAQEWHGSREDRVSFIHEKGVFRGLGASDCTLPPKVVTIQIFSDASLAVFQANGDIVIRGIRR